MFADVPATVLDLGGGSGVETPFRGQVLVDIFHVNPVAAVEACTRIGRVVESFSLVVLAHILERVPDPIDLLTVAAEASIGFVFVVVPAEAEGYGTRPRLKTVPLLHRVWHEHIQ